MELEDGPARERQPLQECAKALGLTGAAAARPLAALAQQPAMPVIGFIHSGNAASTYAATYLLPGSRQGLKDIGYVEGQNVAIEYRWAEGQYGRLPALAADLVGRRVSVIVATDNTAAQAAKAANTTIPIVFSIGADPVKLGLVASFARPGGNVTGVSFLSTITAAIRLQMLHEAVPNASVIGALINPSNPNAELNTQESQEATRALLDVPGATLLMLPRLLIDEPFRVRLVEHHVTDPVVRSFWMNEYAGYSDSFRTEAISPIQNKIGKALIEPRLRNMLAQPKSTITLRRLIGYVILEP